MSAGRLVAKVAVPVVVASALLPVPMARAALSVTVEARDLKITGDGGDDIVSVSCVNGRVKVNGVNPDDGPFDCDQLIGISLSGGAGEDVIDLTAVTASAFPSMAEPSVYAGADDDIVTSSPIGAFLSGDDGDDTLNGRGGPDRIGGGPGIDALDGAGGTDVVFGMYSGAITLTPDELVAGAVTDTLANIEESSITANGPTYDGTAFTGPQRVFAGAGLTATTGPGNDTLVSVGAGVSSFNGGAGTDTVEGQLVVDAELDAAAITIGGTAATLTNIERAHLIWLTSGSAGGMVDARGWDRRLRYENWSTRSVTFLGGSGPDRGTGGSGRDVMRGLRGRDDLAGGAGNDTLDGGRGRDRCRGGPGVDVLKRCERT